jgi:catechol 2,3-dioxygenase-like lactoylglutathione lyase family enzyme
VGSAEQPVVLTAGQAPLTWTTVPGSTKDLVTVGARWTVTVVHGGASAHITGPHPRTISAGAHSRITDAYLDGDHALVVSEDRFAHDPDRATLVDLATGHTTTLDAGSEPPTVVGGTWALGPHTLVHATSGSRHRYCLATVDLSDGSGSTGWCALPRNGFRGAVVTDDGTTMMTFDDHHPSCRVLNEVEGARLLALAGVTPCKGWDSALLGGTRIWSVVPNEHRIDAAHFYAQTPGGWYDLGPGTSGSLVACAGSAFFTRDPQSRSDPATLLRWDPAAASLSVAFATTATGNAFLSPPRCGATDLTVTAYSQAGDEQVTAPLG